MRVTASSATLAMQIDSLPLPHFAMVRVAGSGCQQSEPLGDSNARSTQLLEHSRHCPNERRERQRLSGDALRLFGGELALAFAKER